MLFRDFTWVSLYPSTLRDFLVTYHRVTNTGLAVPIIAHSTHSIRLLSRLSNPTNQLPYASKCKTNPSCIEPTFHRQSFLMNVSNDETRSGSLAPNRWFQPRTNATLMLRLFKTLSLLLALS